MPIELDGTTGISTTGNITCDGTFQAGTFVPLVFSTAGNVIAGNLNTGGLVSATGNVTGGNIITAGRVTATGNVTSSANVTGGNIITAGIVTATGNVTGNFILGNGSQLTGIDATSIQSGTSNVRVVSSGGNVAIGIAGTSNVGVFSSTGLQITGDLSVTGNATLSGNILGDRIQNGTTQIDIQTLNGNANITVAGTSNVAVFASSGLFVTGLASVTGNVIGGNLLTGGLISATGNVTAGNVDTAGLISATGNVTAGNILTGGLISATGNVTAGNLSVGTGTVTVNNIVNSGANGTGNIGNSTVYFNTVFAKATSAQYADLAEYYRADAEYAPGTVVEFGGQHEVTVAAADSAAVAGVVSTNPAYIMNAGLSDDCAVPVALMGRVPTSVTGIVRKGDMMVSAGDGTAKSSSTPIMGTVIGKSLENFDGVSGIIEIVVGRI